MAPPARKRDDEEFDVETYLEGGDGDAVSDGSDFDVEAYLEGGDELPADAPSGEPQWEGGTRAPVDVPSQRRSLAEEIGTAAGSALSGVTLDWTDELLELANQPEAAAWVRGAAKQYPDAHDYGRLGTSLVAGAAAPMSIGAQAAMQGLLGYGAHAGEADDKGWLERSARGLLGGAGDAAAATLGTGIANKVGGWAGNWLGQRQNQKALEAEMRTLNRGELQAVKPPRPLPPAPPVEPPSVQGAPQYDLASYPPEAGAPNLSRNAPPSLPPAETEVEIGLIDPLADLARESGVSWSGGSRPQTGALDVPPLPPVMRGTGGRFSRRPSWDLDASPSPSTPSQPPPLDAELEDMTPYWGPLGTPEPYGAPLRGPQPAVDPIELPPPGPAPLDLEAMPARAPRAPLPPEAMGPSPFLSEHAPQAGSWRDRLGRGADFLDTGYRNLRDKPFGSLAKAGQSALQALGAPQGPHPTDQLARTATRAVGQWAYEMSPGPFDAMPVNAQGAEQVAYADAPTTHWALQSVLSAGRTGLDEADEQALTRAVVSGNDDEIASTDYRLRQRYPRYAAEVERAMRSLHEGE